MSTAAQDLETKALSVPDRAKALKIETADQYIEAGELLKTIKGLRAEIDETFDPIISKAFSAHREAIAQKKKVDAPLVEAENILRPRVTAYLQEQERLRREAELLAEKAAREEAERQQLADAALLDDIGETDMANALLKEAPAVAPVILPKSTPKVTGIIQRTNWRAQVTDFRALVLAVASGKAPIQCLKADDAFLGAQARAMKQALNYPGVRAVPDNNISVRR